MPVYTPESFDKKVNTNYNFAPLDTMDKLPKVSQKNLAADRDNFLIFMKSFHETVFKICSIPNIAHQLDREK